jgi:hypothetical protein
MRSKPAVSLLAALLSGMSVSLAQQGSPPADAQQQQQQEKAQQTPSGQTGKEEPSSHAPTPAPQNNAALVNGRLAVPGAPENSDAVPAKFSEKNDADDRLSPLAYTFKLLTAEQRRAIYEGLKDQPAAVDLKADFATQLPLSVELRPIPDTIVGQVPDTKGFDYIVTNGPVLLVSPVTRVVVGIFSDAP